jgi:hypothetical protein
MSYEGDWAGSAAEGGPTCLSGRVRVKRPPDFAKSGARSVHCAKAVAVDLVAREPFQVRKGFVDLLGTLVWADAGQRVEDVDDRDHP